MLRTRLAQRVLPAYTRGEERFHMVSHIVGAGLGVAAFLACIIVAAYHRNIWGIVSGAVYGSAVILLFTMSSIYHGLAEGIPKKVFQVLDHCTIFILIAGTYTPILLGRYREVYPAQAWALFGVIWGLAALGVALNAIDLKRFRVFSMLCYLGMGWLIVFSAGRLIEVLGGAFFRLLILGGVFYTVGALLYVIGKSKKKKYIHAVFHIFVDIAAVLHCLGIIVYTMP